MIIWVAVSSLLVAGVVSLSVSNRQHDQETEAARAALAVAVASVPPVLSYRAATVESDLAAAEKLLVGKFKTNFVELGRDVVAPMAKKDRISTTARVDASAVTATTGDEVVALLFITQTTTGKALDEPRVTGSRLSITLTLVDGKWLISDLHPV